MDRNSLLDEKLRIIQELHERDTVKLTFSVPPDLKRKFQHYCKTSKIDQNLFLTRILRKLLDEEYADEL